MFDVKHLSERPSVSVACPPIAVAPGASLGLERRPAAETVDPRHHGPWRCEPHPSRGRLPPCNVPGAMVPAALEPDAARQNRHDDSIVVVDRAGRSGVHAPGEWLADDLLDRDASGLDRDALVEQRRLRLRAELWALVSGHWSAWQAARVEVEQQRQAYERVENPVEERVVDRLVARTEIERITGRVR